MYWLPYVTIYVTFFFPFVSFYVLLVHVIQFTSVLCTKLNKNLFLIKTNIESGHPK